MNNGFYEEKRNNDNKRKRGVFLPVLILVACLILCIVSFSLGRNYFKGNSEEITTAKETSAPATDAQNTALYETAGREEASQTAEAQQTAVKETALPSATASERINGNETDVTTAPAAPPKTGDDITVLTAGSANTYSIKDAAKLTMDTVVEISTESVTTGTFMQQYISQGAGSGVIISKDGYIVTNNHVIEGASSITVRLRNGQEYSALLVGTDPDADIAVIKIDATGLSAAVMGDSSKMEVGDIVLAIGNPLGKLGGTVTSGIISATERQINIGGVIMNLLQTSAAVNPGNSGGGLFNLSGELIGIVNAKSSGEDVEGLGFAIPTNTAITVIDDLITYGYTRGKINLGLSFVDIYNSNYAWYYGVSLYGTYVLSVESGSDAEKAGFIKGDIIKSINGAEIKSADAITEIVSRCGIGDTLEFVVTRTTVSGRQTSYNDITINLTFTEYVPANISSIFKIN